ncbi:MAG: sensor histidine kinase [Agriterribacter sp.]
MLKSHFNSKFPGWFQNGISVTKERMLIQKERVLKTFSLLSTALLIYYFILFSNLHFFPKSPLCIVVVLLPVLVSLFSSMLAFREKINASLLIITWLLPVVMAVASWHNPVYNYSKVVVICMLVVFLVHYSTMQQLAGFLFLAIAYSWMHIRYHNSIVQDLSNHALMLDFTMMLVLCAIMFFVFSGIKREFISYQRECNIQKDNLEQRKSKLENLVELSTEKSNQLKRSVLFKEKLISVVSHDVRTPINSFKFMIENYESGHITQQMLIDALLETKKDIINLDKMVVDLVNWKREDINAAQSGRMSYSALTEMFDSVKSIYNLAAKNKQLDIVTAISIQENTTLSIPRRDTEIIIRNLLSNAIKFSHPQGRIILKLRVFNGVPHSSAVLTVRDFGTGMSADVLKMLNNNKVISTRGTLDEAGLGVGLSFVFDIINKHRLEYKIKSEWEKGTAFYIKIPAITNETGLTDKPEVNNKEDKAGQIY